MISRTLYCIIILFLVFYALYGESFSNEKFGGGNNIEKYVSSCREGLIRGTISGFVTGGPSGAFLYGSLNGFLNPLMEKLKQK